MSISVKLSVETKFWHYSVVSKKLLYYIKLIIDSRKITFFSLFKLFQELLNVFNNNKDTSVIHKILEHTVDFFNSCISS